MGKDFAWGATSIALTILLSLTKNVIKATIPVLPVQNLTKGDAETKIELPYLVDFCLIGMTPGGIYMNLAASYITPIIQALQHVENFRLTLDGVCIYDLASSQLPRLSCLTVENFTQDLIPGVFFGRILRDFPRLTELIIEQDFQCYGGSTGKIPPSFLAPLLEPVACQLERLQLGGKTRWITAEKWEVEGGIRTTCRLPALKELCIDVSLCGNLRIANSLTRLIENCPALQVLELREIDDEISEEAIAYFSRRALAWKFPSLSELRLSTMMKRSYLRRLNRICEPYSSALSSANIRLVLRLSLFAVRYPKKSKIDFNKPVWDRFLGSVRLPVPLG